MLRSVVRAHPELLLGSPLLKRASGVLGPNVADRRLTYWHYHQRLCGSVSQLPTSTGWWMLAHWLACSRPHEQLFTCLQPARARLAPAELVRRRVRRCPPDLPAPPEWDVPRCLPCRTCLANVPCCSTPLLITEIRSGSDCVTSQPLATIGSDL